MRAWSVALFAGTLSILSSGCGFEWASGEITRDVRKGIPPIFIEPFELNPSEILNEEDIREALRAGGISESEIAWWDMLGWISTDLNLVRSRLPEYEWDRLQHAVNLYVPLYREELEQEVEEFFLERFPITEAVEIRILNPERFQVNLRSDSDWNRLFRTSLQALVLDVRFEVPLELSDFVTSDRSLSEEGIRELELLGGVFRTLRWDEYQYVGEDEEALLAQRRLRASNERAATCTWEQENLNWMTELEVAMIAPFEVVPELSSIESADSVRCGYRLSLAAPVALADALDTTGLKLAIRYRGTVPVIPGGLVLGGFFQWRATIDTSITRSTDFDFFEDDEETVSSSE